MAGKWHVSRLACMAGKWHVSRLACMAGKWHVFRLFLQLALLGSQNHPLLTMADKISAISAKD